MDGAPHRLIRALQSEIPGAKGAKEAFTRSVRRALHKPHEREFAVISLLKPSGQCFVDVGANTGQSIESIRLFAPDVRLHAFEANGGLARQLTARYGAQDSVRIHSVGLGKHEGQFILHVPTYRHMTYDGLASVDRDEAANWLNHDRVFGFRPDQLTIEALTCEIRTLDSFILDPCLIKIDVQGLELDVILGGLKTVCQSEPLLLIEAPTEDLVSVLADNGFHDLSYAGGVVSPGINESGAGNRLFATSRRLRELTAAH